MQSADVTRSVHCELSRHASSTALLLFAEGPCRPFQKTNPTSRPHPTEITPFVMRASTPGSRNGRSGRTSSGERARTLQFATGAPTPQRRGARLSKARLSKAEQRPATKRGALLNRGKGEQRNSPINKKTKANLCMKEGRQELCMATELVPCTSHTHAHSVRP